MKKEVKKLFIELYKVTKAIEENPDPIYYWEVANELIEKIEKQNKQLKDKEIESLLNTYKRWLNRI